MKKIRIFSLILALSLLAGPLAAAGVRRSFTGDQPVGVMVQRLLEAMGKRGIAFDIQKVYDAKKDGKHGMVLRLKPAGTFASILFVDKGKKSVFHLITQDYNEANRIGRVFVTDLKMAEIGRGPDKIDDSRSGWPVSGLK